MKSKFFLIFLFAAFFLLILVTTVLAQEEPPAPYAGLENPFSWDDASTQEAGKVIFQKSCAGCHVAPEGGTALGGDFSAADFPQSLEESPDFYFWTVSEGRLDKGMLAFKSSFSEEERWQALTYIWSLGGTVPPTPPPDREEGTLLLTLPEQAQSGQPLALTATLLNEEGEPVAYARVKFLIEMDFFASGLMEIGEAVTNEQGDAVFEYIPRQTGRQTGEITNLPLLSQIQVIARYEGDGLSPVETATTLTLVEADEPFYQAEAGIRLPALGAEVFIGPESALELGEGNKAPTSAFYLPGGIVSWLLLVVAVVILVWFTYFRVVYQVFRIPIVSEIRDTNTRLVPLAGLAIVLVMGIMLVLFIVTGPYSHWHLLR